MKTFFEETIAHYKHSIKEGIGHDVQKRLASLLDKYTLDEALLFIQKNKFVEQALPKATERIVTAFLGKTDQEPDLKNRAHYVKMILTMDDDFRDPYVRLKDYLLMDICSTSLDLTELKKLKGKIKDRVYKSRASDRLEYFKNGVFNKPPMDFDMLQNIFKSINADLDLTEGYRELCIKHKHDPYLEVNSKDLRPFIKTHYPDFRLDTGDRALDRDYYIKGLPFRLRIYFRGLIEVYISTNYTSTNANLSINFRNFMPHYSECIKRDLLPAPTISSVDEIHLVISDLIKIVDIIFMQIEEGLPA